MPIDLTPRSSSTATPVATAGLTPKSDAGLTPITITPDPKTTPGAQDGTQDKATTADLLVVPPRGKVEDLPEWAQRELKAVRKEAADRRKALLELEEAGLTQAQLAEKRSGELDALKPKAELADKLSEMVLAQYEAAIKDWPAEVRAMAPPAEANVLEKLAWMEKAKPLAAELMANKQPIPGNGRGQRPVGSGTGRKAEKIDPVYDVKRNF